MYSVNYVKKQLGVSSQTVHNYVKLGKIEAVKLPNGRFYFTQQAKEKLEEK